MHTNGKRTGRPFRVRSWPPSLHRIGKRSTVRRGRPRQFGPDAVTVIQALMERSPADYGYDRTVWVVPLLLQVLADHGYSSCGRTLRNLLHDLGWHWDHQYGEWRLHY